MPNVTAIPGVARATLASDLPLDLRSQSISIVPLCGRSGWSPSPHSGQNSRISGAGMESDHGEPVSPGLICYGPLGRRASHG